jgi:hypothetical protein
MPTLQQQPFTSRIAKPAAWRLTSQPAPTVEDRPHREPPRPRRAHAHLISTGPPRGLEDAAIHAVDGIARDREDRCEVHEHAAAELNMILPVTALTCEVVLGDERYEVEGPASVFVPAGLAHAINVTAGTGYFVSVALGPQ